jgi:predicted tellurium resistance membrane protein TerC
MDLPGGWIALFTLTALEIALGVDNIVFLTIMVSRLPLSDQARARRLGVLLATVSRLMLLLALGALASVSWPLLHVFDQTITTRSLVLMAGGLFLVAKGVVELRRSLRPDASLVAADGLRTLWPVVLQIALIDIVFSLDSVFAALGLAQQLSIMVVAILLATGAMLFVASYVGRFLADRPALKLLVLVFMMVIGLGLMADSVGRPIPRPFIYFFMLFAVVVESLHRRILGRRSPAA